MNHIVKEAIKRGKVTKYEDFCKTEESLEWALTPKEIEYYTNLNTIGNLMYEVFQSFLLRLSHIPHVSHI